jgi:phosphoribosyl 1,2-cyclic phosphodiesterase
MEVCVLASSSAGNAIAVRAGGRALLLDAGLSARVIVQRLADVGWSASDLAAVVLSHEHADHVRGAGVLARRLRIPVYGTAGTLEALASLWRGGEDLRTFEVGLPFHPAGAELQIDPFTVPHDVADPAQFLVRNAEGSLGVATDLGRVTTLVAQKLATADLVVLEANHDADRLRWGAYPWGVKQRIASPHGHLDNAQAAELSVRLAMAGVGHLVLAHLSPHHNDVETVRRVVSAALAAENLSPRLTVLAPNEGTGIITVARGEHRA